MYRLILPAILVCLLSISAPSAWGQCVDDGNNSALDAEPVTSNEVVTDVVCPDDAFDYYTLEIPGGADVSGTVTLVSAQPGTTLKISGPGSDVFNAGTTNSNHTLLFTVPPGGVPSGVYYFRVGFYSNYAFDHEYTLTVNLTITIPPGCELDNNDDPANAGSMNFGDTVSDWVCGDDHIDIWHFTVGDPSTEGRGTVSLSSEPNDIKFYLYDASHNSIFESMTTSGEIDYLLGTETDPLAAGDYYIGVFLPMARNDQNSYTLRLNAYSQPFLLMEDLQFNVKKELYTIAPCAPWPCLHGDARNSGRSEFSGPGAGAALKAEFFLDAELGVEDDPETHTYKMLLAGPNNRVYFRDNREHMLCAFDLTTGFQWRFQVPYEYHNIPFSIDEHGFVYVIHQDGVRLYKLDHDGNEIWSDRIEGSSGYYTEVWPVGKLVYVSDYVPGEHSILWGEGFIHSWLRDGTPILSEAKLQEGTLEIHGIAQDTDGPAYVFGGTTMYRYNMDGANQWSRELHNAESPFTLMVPVVGEDKKVWTYLPNIHRRCIYNANGTLYEDYKYPDNSDVPKEICLGNNGRLYVSTNRGDLVCYENWNQEVWRTPNPGESRIMRIVMDNDDFIYLLYYTHDDIRQYHWCTVHPDDGRILFTYDIKILEFDNCVDPWGDLAIGEGNTLIYLNECGYLAVYEKALVPLVPQFKIDPSRLKLRIGD